MKALLITVAILGLVACEEGKWGVEEEDHVAVLNKDNFDDFLKNNKYVFVKFYAPWCGHCKTMAPGYSKLAQRMKNEDNGVPIAKVDATVESDIAQRFEVKGFPTLKLFIDGQPVDYSGAREEDPIYNWIQKKSGPATTEMTSTEDIKGLEKKKLAVLLVVEKDNADMLKNFNSVAAGYDDIPFYYTYNNSIKEEYKLNGSVAFVVFRDFDDGMKVLINDTGYTVAEMKEFLDTHRFPLVMPFEQEAAERIFGSESPAIFVFSDEKDTEAAKLLAEAAKENRSSGLVFSWSTITSGLGARLSEFLGVTSKDANTVRIVKFSGGNLMKYKLANVNKETLAHFIDDWKNNKLEPYFKSEPVPESNDQPVKVIVGDNFEDLVLNSDKYVLLEAYAPWCGHCKQLEPIYNELAEKLKSVDDLLIAKMDATANEHSSVNVRGFPTLKFYKKGEKSSPMDYSGERTVDGFIAFLEKEMGRKLTDAGSQTDTDL